VPGSLFELAPIPAAPDPDTATQRVLGDWIADLIGDDNVCRVRLGSVRDALGQ
jgi:hypothetical protein